MDCILLKFISAFQCRGKVEILPFPLLWLLAFYNSLYYRTSRDVDLPLLFTTSCSRMLVITGYVFVFK